MKILCAYSGIQFDVQHFPASLTARECVHPIFYIQQKKLLGYTSKYFAGELTETDSYLLFLSLLHSTDLIEWRTAAIRNDRTKILIANNMEHLAKVISKINLIRHPHFALAKIAITPETRNLDTIRYWVQDWNAGIEEFESGYKAAIKHDRLVTREQALEKIIRAQAIPSMDRMKQLAYLAKHLADWAADAGEFPRFTLVFEGKGMTCEDYWKLIIIRCIKEDQVFRIPKKDIQELIEHCEENIEAGTIYHHALMQILRGGLQKQSNYLGLGDVDITTSTYRILDANVSVEDANKLALIDSAPKEKPIESEYPSRIAWLRAKLKYDMAQEYYSLQQNSLKTENKEEISDSSEQESPTDSDESV